ncbi:MAG: NAD(P)/FAD-dependent oxidoreductase [Sphingobacteriales bacterium]|nr:MAG: NAD(P)/FAD-dependent oxidoreductase [Sphingobacteriales bacterium]
MEARSDFDVVIVGGSNSGLSAGMALGRSLRTVLIVDSGKPCNWQTSHSHNFIMHDGWKPADMRKAAMKDVLAYPTVEYVDGTVTAVTGSDNNFEVTIKDSARRVTAGKIVFATGIKDIFVDIDGLAECWGISVIHCPYCHGYEYHGKITGILANGDAGFEMMRLINNWTKLLTVFTNGPATFTPEQLEILSKHSIHIVENEISRLRHKDGYLQHVVFKDDTPDIKLDALYARLPFVQHTDAPAKLGCAFTEQGLLQIDGFQKTTVPGVFACGDNSTFMRSVAVAVASGNMAGIVAGKEFFEKEF